MKGLKVGLAMGGLVVANPVMAAGGYTAIGTPTQVEVVRGDGFLVHGPFGNPGATPCDVPDRIWVARAHPQYQELLATALTALSSGMKLQGYSHVCTNVAWFGVTLNEVTGSSSLTLVR